MIEDGPETPWMIRGFPDGSTAVSTAFLYAVATCPIDVSRLDTAGPGTPIFDPAVFAEKLREGALLEPAEGSA